jgi:nitrate/TMAO reductase-like tetraheme cytochrome c subunit
MYKMGCVKNLNLFNFIHTIKTYLTLKNLIFINLLQPNVLEKIFMGRLRWYQREEVLERDNFKCRICQAETDLTIHHIRHWAKGGDHKPQNLVTLCFSCHNVIHKDLKHMIQSGQDPLLSKDIILELTCSKEFLQKAS